MAFVKVYGTGELQQSLGKYFDIMAVLDILLLQITNKPYLTWPYLGFKWVSVDRLFLH